MFEILRFLPKLFIFFYLFTTTIGSNSNDKNSLLPKSIDELKKYYEVIENLEQRGILTQQQANDEKQLYIEYGSKLIGKDKLLTRKEFLEYGKRLSVISFANIIAVFAGFIAFIAGLFFTCIFVIPNITDIPATTWEKIFYFADFYLTFMSSNSWLVFLGCLTFLATLILSHSLGRFGDETSPIGTIIHILMISWPIVAVYQQSYEAGFLAIAILQFYCFIHANQQDELVVFGFTRDRICPAATLSAFCLLVAGIFLHMIPANCLTIPFIRPLLFIGALVYFIGLAVLSSKSYYKYCQNNDRRLLPLFEQITLFSGLASTFLAPVLGIPFIVGIGGTMFVLWILKKYIQYAKWTGPDSIFLSLCGMGLLLYVLAYLNKTFLRGF